MLWRSLQVGSDRVVLQVAESGQLMHLVLGLLIMLQLCGLRTMVFGRLIMAVIKRCMTYLQISLSAQQFF